MMRRARAVRNVAAVYFDRDHCSTAPRDVVFLSAVRTGFGSFGGTLKDHTATDLGAAAARCAIARSGLEPADVQHVIVGNVLQTSGDAAYLARHVGLRAEVPVPVPAVTVNRLCGSGFEAVIQGAHRIMLGEADVVLAGGAESMSQAPHVLRGSRWGLKLGAGPKLEDTLTEALRDAHCGLPMGETAERLAERYGVSRAECDEYAARSQSAAAAGWKSGAFAAEVVPIAGPQSKDQAERELGCRRAHAPGNGARRSREARAGSSARAAWSPPATPPASPTARARSCWRAGTLPNGAASARWGGW